MLSFLAGLGLVLGTFGALSSVAIVLPLVDSRDSFVSMYREIAEKQRALPTELGGPEIKSGELVKEAEREGDIYYGRRGTAIPLAIVNFVLSGMLFIGCGGALRGLKSGVQNWRFALWVSILYHAVDTAFALVQSNDLRAAVDPSTTLGQFVEKTIALRSSVLMFKGASEVIFFLICLVYLQTRLVNEFVAAHKVRR